MNKKNSAKRSTEFLQNIEELFQSVWIWLHVRFMRISMMSESADIIIPKLVDVIRSVMASPGRITLVQKRVINRFRYPLKFTLFRLSLALRIPGARLATT
ncbi:hypothetical protein [Albibacterium indicum]|uniref:hypothetical protein n=1 Tax=Albibacterium indicum TaxID=2292082 RepID=UPI0013008691|nr:hypothetical protein [Pedobacter indicus]